jgi:HSP20 family molecular chaperone IbpA
MSTTSLTRVQKGTVAAILALCALVVAAIVIPNRISAADAQQDNKSSSGFLAPLRQWQEKMTDVFRDTFKNLAGKNGADTNTGSSVSADLREQNDSYTLRVNLPNRNLDKVEVRLEGNRVRVVAPEEGAARSYEQTITLGDLPPDPKLNVERKQQDGVIVVTVPKSNASSSIASTPTQAPAPSKDDAPGSLRRDLDIMDSMERMRRDMDRIFQDSFRSFKMLPDYLPDYGNWFDEHRFGSSYEVNEEGDSYVVRIYLPDRDMQNVSVKVDGQTLLVDASAEGSKSSDAGVDRTEKKVHRAQFSQRLTLPGPVNSIKMKTERKDNMLIVTLPKAKPGDSA